MSEFEEISPTFKNALITKMKSVAPYWALLGMELVDLKKGWALVKLPFSEKLTQPDGIAHGGSIFSSADAAVAMALLGMIDKNETMVTVEMKINFVKSFNNGEIVAEAKIVHKGGKTAIGEVDVRNSNGELIAKGMATFMIIKRK